MNPISAIIRHFRRKKMIELESKVAGLTAKLKRTEQLAKVVPTDKHDMRAIEITQELWEKKRLLQLLAEEDSTTPRP